MVDLTRRTLLKMAGGATIGFGFPGKILAVLADGTLVVQDHQVPANKGLSPEWRSSLVARGKKEVWDGPALESIGMPIGGIAAGQLYLCGDGTLGCWEIFNHHSFQDQGPYSYAKRNIPKDVEFGFSISVDGKTWKLKSGEFAGIQFRGEYPIGAISYRDETCPVEVESTVYSPFIPLNAKDSALPATIFEITVRNHSDKSQEIALEGMLENACGRAAQAHVSTRKRHTTSSSTARLTVMTHGVDDAIDDFPAAPTTGVEPPSVIADFEGDTYGDWKVEGTAFGTGPAKGTLPGQQQVTGFVGTRLVNSFLGGDDPMGRLTSPTFKIERSFINFKIGGGDQPGKACVNLVIDGKVVRTDTGRNEEKLLWDAWNVREYLGKTAHIEIVDQAQGGWGHINVDQIQQADYVMSPQDIVARHGDVRRDVGTLSLGVLTRGTASSNPSYGLEEPFVGRVQPSSFTLAPGKSKTITFVLGWHFPHHPNGRNYSNYFQDSAAVVAYVAKNFRRLSRDTKLWRDTFYDSTLPYWLLDRLHSTIGNLCTGTTEWWKSGRFWSWEGVVCCSGTCTHVWNYEHSMARLFPELERNVRDLQDFGEAFDETTGLVGFRGDREYAADGQCGTILKAYREHLTSADNQFLKGHWARIKKALQFLITHDGNGDGLIEDAQPNTYDIEFFGANTFVGSLYLAALRAGEEMAREMADLEFQAQCQSIFEAGSTATMKRLWNGEYFIQEVDESRYKKYQYGPGCLCDQLFGQGWAHQVGLGYLYPQDKVKKVLESVWKYNWAPDVAGQNKRWPPQRPFALPGEAGLFVCTWPVGGREGEPVLYRDEVWTGCEYQVAGHMIWEGLVEEGLSICRAIHERYHPLKRNPYNEVECSDHYSRAMASWGVFTAVSGFEYDGPAGRLAFSPKVSPNDFRSAFTTAEGWGSFSQKHENGRSRCELTVTWGQLRLSQLSFGVDSILGSSVRATMNGQTVQGVVEVASGKITLKLDSPIDLKAGSRVSLEWTG